MIVVIHDEVFASEDLDSALLLELLRQGQQLRFRVRTRPSFSRSGDRAVNRWIDELGRREQEIAVGGFEAGLRGMERKWPAGRREARVEICVRDEASWPRSFDDDAAYLPLGDEARDLLSHGLCLKLENELSDWEFVRRCVPKIWRSTWERAVRRKWIKPEQGGGGSEIRRIIEEAVAKDPIRRLRMWAMFDSDALELGEPHKQAKQTQEACERIGVPHHMLERRKIENYVPERAMREWAKGAIAKVAEQTQKRKTNDKAKAVERFVDAYWQLPALERHYAELKTHDHFLKKQGLGTVADIWRDDESISEAELDADGWRDERERLFLGLFASY